MKAELILVVLLLAGCISTNPASWTRTRDDQTAANAAIFYCQREGDAESYRMTAYGGVIMPVVGLFSRRSVFNQCMEAQGYRPALTP